MVVKFEVYKKNSPNDKISVFLPKRDFIEKSSHCEPIEGVLLIDPNYVGDQKVFVQLLITFRYGNESDEAETDNMSASLKKSFYIDTHQVYPPNEIVNVSDVQMNLATRLGSFAYPFILELPKLGGPSYSMQRGWKEEGAVMGMQYEVMAFVGFNDNDIRNRSSCKLVVRKLQDIPHSLQEVAKPHGTITKTMITGMGTVTIDCTLSGPVFRTGEMISVVIKVQNNTQRLVKMIKVKVIQRLECPFLDKTRHIRARTISKVEDKILLKQGCTTSRDMSLLVSPPPKPKCGDILLQSQFDRNTKDILAYSTIYSKGVQKEDVFGIVVYYAVKVKATLGLCGMQGEVVLCVPFTVKA